MRNDFECDVEYWYEDSWTVRTNGYYLATELQEHIMRRPSIQGISIWFVENL